MSSRAPNGLVHVYALHDPTDQSARVYVGQSINPGARFEQHLRDAAGIRKRDYRSRWILGLRARGVEPAMTILETVPPGGDYQEAERFWIASLRVMGVPLVNGTDGGDGSRGYVWDEEQRSRLTAIRRRRPTRSGASGFRGVRAKAGGFDARFSDGGSATYLGHYKTAVEAACAYDMAARERWGSDAGLNFPRPGERSARPGIEPRDWQDLPAVTIRRADSTVNRNNRSGFTGVSWSRDTGKWYAAIKIGGKSISLGFYDQPEAAAASYQRAKSAAKPSPAERRLRVQLTLITGEVSHSVA